MSFFRTIGIGLVLLAGQLSASAAEVAMLRNGFSITFVRKQQTGSVTRLFTANGFIDVPTSEIASFEKEDPPAAPPASSAGNSVQPVAQSDAAGGQMMAEDSAANAPNAMSVPATRGPAAPVDLDQVVREASSRHQLDPDFVKSVIKAESNFHPHAVSSKGAQGLMQLMPQTASKLGVTDPFDPKANVEAGTAHLSALMDLYHNDAIKALAAYNAGAHRVDQYHGVPPYRETRAYVAKIVRDFNAKKRAEMKANAAKAPAKTSAAKTNAPTAAKKKSATPKRQQASVPKTNKPA
jgi:soluble lytic murein transglycosylase-like protein